MLLWRELFAGDQLLHAHVNLIANLSSVRRRFALGIFERPVIVNRSRHDWTLIAAAHRNEVLRGSGQIRRQPLRSDIGEVETDLIHHGNHFGMDGGTRVGAGRDGMSFPGIGQHVEQRRRHLRSSRVVHTRKQHGLHVRSVSIAADDHAGRGGGECGRQPAEQAGREARADELTGDEPRDVGRPDARKCVG